MNMRWIVLSLIAALGCSSPKLAELPPSENLATEIPKELQEKFQVRAETPPAEVPREGETRKVPAKLAATTQKKTKEKAAFVYPVRRTVPEPFRVGESMVLEVTYIGLVAGEFTLNILPTVTIQNRKAYHIVGNAKSSSMFSLFYRVDDSIESYMDFDGLFSHRYHMKLNESKQTRDALELYDNETKKVFFWNRRNHVTKGYEETKEYFDIESFSQDSLSAVYYLRTLPIEVGKTIVVPIVSEGKSWEAVNEVLAKEVIDVPALGMVECFKIKPQTRYQGVLKQQKAESFLWITADSRRLIARLQANVKIGSILAQLKSFK